MKKLIAILLALVCMLSVCACSAPPAGGNGDLTPPADAELQEVLDALSELIRTSTPTQSKVATLTGNADINLKSDLTITMGELSGKTAALYVHEYETLNDVGATEAKTKVVETKEYVDGMGLRIDGGLWEVDQPSFVRRLTPYRMNLDGTLIKSVRTSDDGMIIAFTVPMDNASDVFTSFDAKTIASMTSDISVRIETDGSAVTCMEIVYDTKGVTNMTNPKVEIKAQYSYDLQSITLLK